MPDEHASQLRVTVFGAGYVGAVSAVVLAALGHDVTCVESAPARLAEWQNGSDPLREPGLDTLRAGSHVRFVREAEDLGSADVILVAVGTPMESDGKPDLTQVTTVANEVAQRAREGAIVLMRSTVPVGTCDSLQRGPLRRQHVVSNPEFLREGHAVRDSLCPDRIVAGGPVEARRTIERLYQRIIEGDVPTSAARRRVPLLWMSARSAELAKYAANGFLATKLSFVNEIANLAEAVHADAGAVLESMSYDPRIGAQFLKPGLGWGGSCFPKDTRALHDIANGSGYEFLVLRAAIEQNERQLERFAAAITSSVTSGGRVALLGLAFKAGTADTRHSPAVALATRLNDAGLKTVAYDPAVRVLSEEPRVAIRDSALDACIGADAIAIATEWPEFGSLDLSALRRVTAGDLLFDGRSMVAARDALRAGFRYRGLAGSGD